VNVLTNDLLYIPLRANGVCVRCRFNIFFWLCTPGFVSHSTRRGVPDNSNYAATALDPSGEDDVELLHVSAGNILKNLHWPIAVHISEKIQYLLFYVLQEINENHFICLTETENKVWYCDFMFYSVKICIHLILQSQYIHTQT